LHFNRPGRTHRGICKALRGRKVKEQTERLLIRKEAIDDQIKQEGQPELNWNPPQVQESGTLVRKTDSVQGTRENLAHIPTEVKDPGCGSGLEAGRPHMETWKLFLHKSKNVKQ
jgi:hypothetical protein